jgi:hypothetical protein
MNDMEKTVKQPSPVAYVLPALFTFLIASCNTMQSVSPGGSISGTVSYNSSPVASVNLDLESSSFGAIPGTSTTSGSSGHYSIPLAPSDSSGTYYVGISGAGYNTNNWQINITSASSSFALDIALTKLITLTAPASGATGVGTSPTVTWDAGSDCTTYEVKVANASSGDIVFDHSGITGTSYQVSGLTSGTQYTVMISGSSSSGISVGYGYPNFTA